MSPLALFALAVNLLAVAAITGLFANAGKLFGPTPVHQGDAEMPYETGLPPLAPAHERMTVLYHRFAVLFVVFDVDLAFLLPWALNRPQLDLSAMLAVTGFTVIVLFMLAYFWRKGALECRLEDAAPAGTVTTQLDAALGWARKYSIFQYPFVTACCGMEYMSTAASHYDMDRFGAGFPRFSPRQADCLLVVGTISHKMAPVLRRIYDQMASPKWVVAFGVCTCTGGFYNNYSTVQGIDTIVPVDLYIPGCPPRPETVIQGLVLLQEKIQKTGGRMK